MCPSYRLDQPTPRESGAGKRFVGPLGTWGAARAGGGRPTSSPFTPAEASPNSSPAAAPAGEPLPFYVYEYAERSGYAIAVEVIDALRDRAANLVGMKVSDAPLERAEP